MISYAIFFISCNGYVGYFFCTWQTSTLFIWGLFNLNSLLYITIVFRVFLLVLTRVAHPKLCFAQKPLLYPKRAQTIEENKQTHISKKKGVQNQSLRILLLHVYLVSSWLHLAYLTSGFLLQNTLTLNWKIKVKQVQKKDGGYKVQQYKILPSFSCKSQVKSRLL